MANEKNEILAHLNGENLNPRWLAAIQKSQKVMEYLSEEVESAGSLAAACMSCLELTEKKGNLLVFNTDGQKLATLKV